MTALYCRRVISFSGTFLSISFIGSLVSALDDNCSSPACIQARRWILFNDSIFGQIVSVVFLLMKSETRMEKILFYPILVFEQF